MKKGPTRARRWKLFLPSEHNSRTKRVQENTSTVLLNDPNLRILSVQISSNIFPVYSCFREPLLVASHTPYMLLSVELSLEAGPKLRMRIRISTARHYHALRVLLLFCCHYNVRGETELALVYLIVAIVYTKLKHLAAPCVSETQPMRSCRGDCHLVQKHLNKSDKECYSIF